MRPFASIDVTALVETGAGVMLLVSPTLVVGFLLGASLDAPAALVVARMAGLPCSHRAYFIHFELTLTS